jgi:hypothetical protein
MTAMAIDSRVMFEKMLVQKRLEKMLRVAKTCSTNTLRVEVRALLGLQSKLVTPEGKSEFRRAWESLTPEMKMLCDHFRAKNARFGA